MLASFKETSRQFLRARDRFGVPVGRVNYKGLQTYTTVCSGFCSLALVVFLVIYFLVDFFTAWTSPKYISLSPEVAFGSEMPKSFDQMAIGFLPMTVNANDAIDSGKSYTDAHLSLVFAD